MQRTPSKLLSLVFVVSTAIGLAADWPRFRGLDAVGVSDQTVPGQWSDSEDILWKTPLPGRGASSPITLGDRIFLTYYSGYGMNEDDPGTLQNLTRHLICIDRANGSVVWQKAAKALMPEQEYRGFVALHGYTSSTPASDGEAIYVYYGRSGVYAYRLDGEELWHTVLGEGLHIWGSGSSPIVHGNLVIVNAAVEGEAVVALDKRTGKEVWRVEGVQESWSTPLVVNLPDGGEELVVNMRGKVLGIDPATGRERWHCTGIKSYVCPAVVAHEGVVYISGGRPPEMLAIRAGGQGDVTDSHVLWTRKKTAIVGTPLYHDGHLYWINRQAIASCAKASDGETIYEERLDVGGRGDKVYASLVLAGGKLYGVSRQDGTVVLDAGPEFNLVEHNRLGDESIFNATPVVSGGALLVRSDQYLYCIGR
ncbi:MAG: PQQ-binding-like beta-propeller repeat protein [Rhodopirellula sp.]|nr:PQQ-binding-like beta-propeller repeat protein [Rhodopirellula sp.]